MLKEFQRPRAARHWPAFLLFLAAGAVLAPQAGCGGAPPAAEIKADASPADRQVAEEAAKPTEEPAQRAAAADAGQESWEVYFIQGQRVGFGRTSEEQVQDEDRGLLRYEGEIQLFLKRFRQATDFGFRISSLETPDGKVLSLTCESELGPQPLLTTGVVEGDKLKLQKTIAGRTATSEFDWPADARGYFAVEQELKRRPLKPGERRTIQALQPLVDALAKVELTAVDYESTELLEGSAELLRVESTVDLQGEKMEQTLWVDRDGDVQKSYAPQMAGMQMTGYRTAKEIALQETEATFDLGVASTVKLPEPLENPHQTRKVRYRVEFNEGDPAAVFASGPTQQVKSTGPHSAEITVEAIGPDTPLPEVESADAAPPADDSQPSDIVQSDDSRIKAMAEEAAGDETDPWKTAVALESYVNRRVEQKNYSTAFATAAEVAESLSGDCTEHAVLLAALARARGIPARAALGLVYAPSQQGFAYHMWTEVYVNGRWIPLDATLGQGGIGAAHLKLADSSLKGANFYSCFLPVAKVIGNLKIEVLEADDGKR